MRLYSTLNITALCLSLAVLQTPSVAAAEAKPAQAANPDSKSAENAAQDMRLPTGVEELANRIAELEAKAQELRQRATDAAAAAGQGATPAEIKEHGGVLQKWAGSLDSECRALRRLKEARQFSQEKTAEAQAWPGFSRTPPYPLALVEQQRDAVAAQRLELQSCLMMLSMHEDSIQRNAAILAERQSALRLAQEDAEVAGADRHASFLAQFAELKTKAAEAALRSSHLGRLVMTEALQARREYVKFLEHKLELAQAQTRFVKEDLDTALEQLAKGMEATQQELNAAIAADPALRRAIETAREELKQAQNAPAAATASQELLNTKRAALEVAQAKAETNDLRIESLRNTLSLHNSLKTIWETRYWATTDHSLSEFKEKEQGYRRRIENQRQWRSLLEGKLNAAMSQAFGLSMQATSAGVSPAERDATRQIQAAWEQRVTLHQRNLGALALVEDLSRRLCDELAARQASASAAGRLQQVVAEITGFAQRVWSTELYVAEDAAVVDGQRILVSRSVTLGRAVIALLIFAVGLLLAHYTRHSTRRSANRWFGDDRKVQFVSVGAAILTVVIGLCVAMSAMRIPWSVFAVTGGALAIGIGFGAQTLVKNFFSGIVLVFGGTVRVGDIVELDGQCGQIVSIGVSRSLLRRNDGIELLVPNNRFMEQSLVNWTHTDKYVRQVVNVGVAYGTPTRRASELLLQAAREHPQVLQNPAAQVLLDELGDSALQFTLRVWVDLSAGTDGSVVRSDLRHRVIELFADANIEMPFVQRDVHLQSVKPIDVRIVGSSSAGHQLP